MKKSVRLATIQDFDLIYEMLHDDLYEQGVLHRFKHSKEGFKDQKWTPKMRQWCRIETIVFGVKNGSKKVQFRI